MAIPKQRDPVEEAFREAMKLADKAIDEYEARVREETGSVPQAATAAEPASAAR
jgi:phage baseplate assembly protein W